MNFIQAARVLITGAAGQIAYSLIFAVARGDLLGPNKPVILHLLDIPQMVEALNGVVLEIEDCSLPLVAGMFPTNSFLLYKSIITEKNYVVVVFIAYTQALLPPLMSRRLSLVLITPSWSVLCPAGKY